MRDEQEKEGKERNYKFIQTQPRLDPGERESERKKRENKRDIETIFFDK